MIMDENVHISSNIPPVHLILKEDTNEKYKSSFKKPSLKYVYSIMFKTVINIVNANNKYVELISPLMNFTTSF